MAHYIKVCPICFEQFYSERLNQTFDKKKCRNKARSIPAKLLQALLEKSAMAIRVVDTIPPALREFINKNLDVIYDKRGNKESELPIGLTDKKILDAAGISLADQQAILQQVQKTLKERRIKELEKEFTEEDNNTQFIDTDDPLKGGSDGFK